MAIDADELVLDDEYVQVEEDYVGFNLVWIALRVVALLLVIWLVLVGYSLVRAAGAANEGRESLNQLRDADATDLMRDDGAEDLVALEEDLRALNSHLTRPWMAPVRAIPVIGRQLESSQKLSKTGYVLAGSLSATILDLNELSEAPFSSGEERLSVLNRGTEIFGQLSADLAAADLGPESGLWGPLSDARSEVGEELADATQQVANTQQAFSALGQVIDGPSRYLVIAASNAEMRAGSGMFLSLGTLDTDGGDVKLSAMTPSWSTNPELGTLPILDADYEQNWGFTSPSGEFRNLAMSPRFDISAPQALAMWENTHPGDKLDGAILLDPVAIAILTESTGPLFVAGEERSTEQVLDYLLNGQYQGVEVQSDRRDELSLVAGQALVRLLSGDFDLLSLAQKAGDIPAGRHFMIWSKDAELQTAWDDLGVAGTLTEDAVAVSLLNRGANKLDYFVRANVEVAAEPVGSGTEILLTVRVRNDVDVSEQPAYVVGPYPNVTEVAGEYVGDLAFNLPALAQEVEVLGVDSARYGQDGPTQFAATGVRILPGEELSVRIRFVLPVEVTQFEISPSARYGNMGWSFDGKRWRDSEPRTLSWST